MAATHHLPPSKRYQQSVSDSSSPSLENNMTFLQNPSLEFYASNSPASSSFGIAVRDRSSSRGHIRSRPSSMVNYSLQVPPASAPNFLSLRRQKEHQSSTAQATDSVNVRGLTCALVSKRIHPSRQGNDRTVQMETYDDVAEGEGMSEEDDDDDNDEEEDDDDEEEEDDEDDDEDGEESRGEPTPTNETTASDEFEWVRGSPMLTNLMQQEKKEKEQCHRRSKNDSLQRGRSNVPDSINDSSCSTKSEKPTAGSKSYRSGCGGETSELTVIAKDSSSGKARSRSRQHGEVDCSGRSPKKSSRTTGGRLLQPPPQQPVVRRREDYLVIGGENESSSSFPSDAQVSENLGGITRHSHTEVKTTGCTLAAHCQHHCSSNPHVQMPQGTCVALSLPPPPPLPMSLPKNNHWDDSTCTCSYENLPHFPTTTSSDLRCLTPGASGSKTLPCYFRSRTPQAYLSAPSPPVSDRECLRPRARSHSRVPRRRKRHFGDGELETRNLSNCSCNCPYNHFRDLALEYMQWRSFFKANGLPPDYDDLQDKVHRMAGENESLSLQVSVLNEQIEAQTDKIRDLEALLETKKGQLKNCEEMLQHGLMTLESQKLDLMSEISNLKLQLTAVEKEKLELEDRVRKVELETIGVKTKLVERERELSIARSQAIGKPLSLSPSDSLKSSMNVIEIEKLRNTLECVMSANLEKDRKIEELQDAVTRYKQVQERVFSSHFRKSNSLPAEDEDASDTTAAQSSGIGLNSKTTYIADKPPLGVRPCATSTPMHSKFEGQLLTGSSSSSIVQNPAVVHMAKGSPSSPRAVSSEEIASIPPRTPPAKMRHGIDPYGTIPRPADSLGTNGSSTPASPSSRSSLSPPGVDGKPKVKGFKKIFGKLRRSNSQQFDKDAPGEFRRGGIRATAGARLGWSKELKGEKEGVDVPFARWDGEKIASWLHDMGLTAYIGDCKRWVKNGDQLLQASSHNLEKELNIKNPLHRKKLQLALQAVGSETEDPMGNLDHNWVTRWLDDVGLPQYKDAFSEGRVDGRVLNFLTVEDLFLMKVFNTLHYISLKRGIQVLRLHNFNPNCLKRRSTPEDMFLSKTSEEVVLWTNHRVMEWLRSVDLSEYAPNLRGSGVHGALMVYEPKFNAELLASLLSIPPNKTLLRRHLATHFKQLVGSDIIRRKRECEASSSYIPLIPIMKIKASRRSQFTILKKKVKNEIYMEDYVCPLDLSDSNLGDDDAQSPTAQKKESTLQDEKLLTNMSSTNV